MTRYAKKKGTRQESPADAENEGLNTSTDTTTVLLQLVVKVTEVLSKNSSLQDEIRDLHSEVKDLKEANKSLLERVEILENNSNVWSSQNRPMHLTAAPSDITAMTSAVADELQARDGKQLNIVIQGLNELTPENASEVNEDRQNVTEEDVKKQVIKMLEETTGVQNPKIVKAFRMGRISDRPRPIKVMCEDRETRSNVLENAKKLRELPEKHVHRRVYIRPDLTQLQRDQDYLRRQELRRRNEEPNLYMPPISTPRNSSPARNHPQRQGRPPDRYR